MYSILLAALAHFKTSYHKEVGEVACNADDKTGQKFGDSMGHDEPW